MTVGDSLRILRQGFALTFFGGVWGFFVMFTLAHVSPFIGFSSGILFLV
jgi:hypothetical protein